MDNPKRFTSHTHTTPFEFLLYTSCSNRTRETVIVHGSLCVHFKYTSTYEDHSADGQSARVGPRMLGRDR
jgi:hypothetical protein